MIKNCLRRYWGFAGLVLDNRNHLAGGRADEKSIGLSSANWWRSSLRHSVKLVS